MPAHRTLLERRCEWCGEGYLPKKGRQHFCSVRCSLVQRNKANAGNGRTLAEVVEHIYANTRPEGGCLVTTKSRDTRGYAQQCFVRDGRKTITRSHRLVAEYYMGPCPDGMEVCHMCNRGRHGCVTASHLRYDTHAENMLDIRRARKG